MQALRVSLVGTCKSGGGVRGTKSGEAGLNRCGQRHCIPQAVVPVRGTYQLLSLKSFWETICRTFVKWNCWGWGSSVLKLTCSDPIRNTQNIKPTMVQWRGARGWNRFPGREGAMVMKSSHLGRWSLVGTPFHWLKLIGVMLAVSLTSFLNAICCSARISCIDVTSPAGTLIKKTARLVHAEDAILVNCTCCDSGLQ